MARHVCGAVLFAGLVPALALCGGRAQSTKEDEKAREVHREFTRALKEKDLARLMKLVDVPFHDGVKIIRDLKELRIAMKGFLDELKDPSTVTPDIKEVLSYPRFRKQAPPCNPAALERLDKMKLTGQDRVVVDASRTCYLIRVRDGKARIVGILE